MYEPHAEKSALWDLLASTALDVEQPDHSTILSDMYWWLMTQKSTHPVSGTLATRLLCAEDRGSGDSNVLIECESLVSRLQQVG